MTRQYSLEFAVESASELNAMDRLKELGITDAHGAKLSDLDRQAGLYIIRVSVDEADITDETYRKLLEAQDVFILSDELSEKRAQEVIKLSAPVERQLKKLLICVLPETERVLGHIIETYQKHKSKFQPTSRIEWCQKIDDFSFGELPKVLEEDITELAKKQLLTSEGLLSMIVSVKDFEALKKELSEFSKPRTIWDSICTILEKPVEYKHASGALIDLCSARNEATHLNAITTKRLKEVKKSQKHIMSYIGKTKSSYRDDLQANMKALAKSMNSILESTVKIDPSIFTSYQKVMTETFKPLTDTITKLQLDATSPAITEIIKQNAAYQNQINKSLTESIDNMIKVDPSAYQETMRQFSAVGMSEMISTYVKEANSMKFGVGKIIAENATHQNKPTTKGDGKTLSYDVQASNDNSSTESPLDETKESEK